MSRQWDWWQQCGFLMFGSVVLNLQANILADVFFRPSTRRRAKRRRPAVCTISCLKHWRLSMLKRLLSYKVRYETWLSENYSRDLRLFIDFVQASLNHSNLPHMAHDKYLTYIRIQQADTYYKVHIFHTNISAVILIYLWILSTFPGTQGLMFLYV